MKIKRKIFLNVQVGMTDYRFSISALQRFIFRMRHYKFHSLKNILFGCLGILLFGSCLSCSSPPSAIGTGEGTGSDSTKISKSPAGDEFTVVDCLLPGQIRRLGMATTYVTPRRPVRTTAEDCAIRGGEYVAMDRADYGTALKVWLETAEKGDMEAQYYVGTIYEKGPKDHPNYEQARIWYRKAADQGYSRAAINLGRLYEQGLGVERNQSEAFKWYARASGLNESDLSLLVNQEAIGQKRHDAGPTIEILDPPLMLTRGLSVERGRILLSIPLGLQRSLTGRVSVPAGLRSLHVNDQGVTVDDGGNFTIELPILQSEQDQIPIDFLALDTQNKQGTLRLLLAPVGAVATDTPAPAQQFSGFGKYHALVIGNDHYHHWEKLKNAVADATAVAQVLQQQYGFQITLLKDATRKDILGTLNGFRATLTPEDNLLIYYAGHGYLLSEIDRGYWIPVDAEINNNTEWIPLPNITDLLPLIKAKHILIIADSCYSGKLSRSSLAKLRPDLLGEARFNMLQTLAQKPTRTALTSGGVRPVLDMGREGHSIFANAFLGVLQENDSILEGERLFLAVRTRVTRSANRLNFEQIPTYSPIHLAGHESLGDFIFVPDGV